MLSHAGLAVRTPPGDLDVAALRKELATGWDLKTAAIVYLPVGAGGHHWRVTAESGNKYFVTVDDLDAKNWLGATRSDVFTGLARAYATARALRAGGLRFVLAPAAARDGLPLRRLGDRYGVSVSPFLEARSTPYGQYRSRRLQTRVLDILAELHAATPVVASQAVRYLPSYDGKAAMEAFLLDPTRPFDEHARYSEPARLLLVSHLVELRELVSAFELLNSRAQAETDDVITHGEPHPGNLLLVGGEILLVDWDTVALAPRERDISSVVESRTPEVERYERKTGRAVDEFLLTLYRLRWVLDDIASALVLLSRPDTSDAEATAWFETLSRELERLPARLDSLI